MVTNATKPTVSVRQDDLSLVISLDGVPTLRLIRDAALTEYCALLRLNGQIAIYRTVLLENVCIDYRPVIDEAISQLPDVMCYAQGQLTIKSRPNDRKVMCRSLMFNATKFVHRDQRLVLSALTVPNMGVVKVQDTGDTSVLYVQLNDLL